MRNVMAVVTMALLVLIIAAIFNYLAPGGRNMATLGAKAA